MRDGRGQRVAPRARLRRTPICDAPSGWLSSRRHTDRDLDSQPHGDPQASSWEGASHGLDHGAGNAANRAGEREREDAGRVHPRALAAAEQLGSLGGPLRGGRVRRGDARLAGRSRDRRAGEGEPRRARQEDDRTDRRPHRRGDRKVGQEAGGDGPLDRGIAGPDHRGARPVRRHGRDRSRPLPRRAAAARLSAQVGRPGAEEPAEQGPGRHAHPRPVQVRVGERAQRRGGEAALRDLPRGGARRGADADGGRQPEPRRPRRRSTPRTPTGGRC